MSSQPAATTMNRRGSPGLRWVAAAVAILVLLGAMILDTKIVTIGSVEDTRKAAFSPEAFGKAEFPNVQSAVEQRAVDAPTLAAAIAKDKAAAEKQYGVPANVGTEFSVKFTGVVGEGKSGIYTVKVADVPDNLAIRVQTGPAINGTDLRDATGAITFGRAVSAGFGTMLDLACGASREAVFSPAAAGAARAASCCFCSGESA